MSDYLQELLDFFRTLERNEAQTIAHQLSMAASKSLLSHKRRMEIPPEYASNILGSICRKYEVCAQMVSDPWHAYKFALWDDEKLFYALQSKLDLLLATMPIEYRTSKGMPGRLVGPYADSLVATIAKLINVAEKELLVVSPYWSEEGVRELELRLEKRPKEHLKVMILTAAERDSENRAGLAAFKKVFRNYFSTEVAILKPRRLDGDRLPFVHAKAIVSDRKRAYLGSANFSQNGLRHSIEMGVSVSGTYALQMHEWFDSISPYFVNYEE